MCSPRFPSHKSIQKIASGNHGSKEPQLIDALEEHILCGEKFTKIYEVSEVEHAEAQRFLADAETTGSPYNSAFPLPLPGAEMELLDGTPVLTAPLVTSLRDALPGSD